LAGLRWMGTKKRRSTDRRVAEWMAGQMKGRLD
jgi:hypothetical protein